jgi:predicted RNA binding protein YcfA (HicA-like mRNA interferase family)
VTRKERLAAWIRSRPVEGSFSDVRALFEAYGWTLRAGGKHAAFVKEGERTFTVPTKRGRMVHKNYLDQIREILNLDEPS